MLEGGSADARVVDFFRDLWGFPDDSTGGVVVDADVVAMRSARAALGDPVVYASREVRPSLLRAARKMRLCVRIVDVDARGRMDCVDLRACMVDRPAIVVANVGSGFSGTVDAVEDIRAVLQDASLDCCSWVHGDASLLGAVVPFVPGECKVFEGLDSASVSGHAFSTQDACAVFVARRGAHVLDGDRAAMAALLDDEIVGAGLDSMRRDAVERIENAQYFVDTVEPHWRAWRDGASPFVVMDRPPDDVVKRWRMTTSGSRARADVTRRLTKRDVNFMTRDLRAAVPVALRSTRSVIHRLPGV